MSVGQSHPFSDYIVYVDETGDHGLVSIDPQFPVFGLVFCLANKEDYVSTKHDVSLTRTVRAREVSITLPRRTPGGSVAGIVQDQDGKPVANVQVANYGNRESQERQTTTDAQGRFILHDLFEGHSGYQVHVSAKGYSPQQLSINPGSADTPTEMTVTIEPGHTLRGRAVNEKGESVNGGLRDGSKRRIPNGDGIGSRRCTRRLCFRFTPVGGSV